MLGEAREQWERVRPSSARLSARGARALEESERVDLRTVRGYDGGDVAGGCTLPCVSRKPKTA